MKREILSCTQCGWVATEQPPFDMAEATWHIYEKHPEVWLLVFGDRPPHDPDIRTEDGRAEFLSKLTGSGRN